MSTQIDLPPSDFAKLEKTSVPSKLDDTAAILEKQLQAEKDSRQDERFIWIFALIMMVNVAFLPHLSWWAIPSFLLELLFLMAVARWLQVHWIVVFLERLFNKYLDHSKKDNQSD